MIPLPSPPKVIEKKGDTTLFEIAGLYPGYGITIGNALRRVLLSSLEGAAITQVKIADAPHEYSALPGVYENVMLILLNLKKLRFKLETKEPQKIILKEQGEKEVFGKHFKLSSEVKLANPEQKIATMTSKDAKLKIEAVVAPGIGYEPLERRDQDKAEVGTIFVDAIYTPVRKVNFRVENMRVGKRTDFDRLRLEITTDGTKDPEDALLEAVEILKKHFALFTPFSKKSPMKSSQEEKVAPSSKQKKSVKGQAKKTKVEDLDISERVKKVLLDNGIKTVAGILQRSKETLGAMEGVGEKSVKEIEKAVQALGLELK